MTLHYRTATQAPARSWLCAVRLNCSCPTSFSHAAGRLRTTTRQLTVRFRDEARESDGGADREASVTGRWILHFAKIGNDRGELLKTVPDQRSAGFCTTATLGAGPDCFERRFDDGNDVGSLSWWRLADGGQYRATNRRDQLERSVDGVLRTIAGKERSPRAAFVDGR